MTDQTAPAPDSASSLMAILAWILGIFTWFIGPLIIYLMYNGKAGPGDQLTREAARNALNWQLTAIIIAIIGAILMFIIVGIFVLWALGIVNIVFCVIGAVKAAQGEAWKSWLTIPMIK